MCCVELALKGLASAGKGLCTRVFLGYATRRFYHLWSRLLRLFSGQVSPPRAFWALLVAFPALSLAGWIATSLHKFWSIYSWFAFWSRTWFVGVVTRPVLGPARQGLTPSVGFPFFLVPLRSLCSVIAQWVSPRTVGLDVSGLVASNDRKEVSQFIVEHVAHFNIHAVQFIGTVAKVTFAVEVSKQQVISHQSISINGVQYVVRGGWSMAQNVLVYNCSV